MEQHYPFTLPPLPYGYDALAPELIEKVLYFHHDKHFAAYVDALNQLLERTPAYQSWPLWKLCLNWEELPDGLRQGVRNNAGGVFNHDLYFRTLHPLPVSAPDTALEGAVVRDFGGMAGLKEAMRKAALRRMPEKWAGKKKLGFPVPTRVWLKEDKYYNIVKEEFLGENAQKFFHTEKLVKLLDDHKNGKADNSRRVWTVYTFLIWYKQFFGEETRKAA